MTGRQEKREGTAPNVRQDFASSCTRAKPKPLGQVVVVYTELAVLVARRKARSYVLGTPLERELDDDAADEWLLLELWGVVVEVASIWRLVWSCMKRA